MAEVVFERELERMYAEAPAFVDADYFALRVEERLSRGWTARRMLIGGLGLLGGVIGGAQLLASGILPQIGNISTASSSAISASFHELVPESVSLTNLPLGGEALWMSAALAVVAIGLGLTRAIREI